MAFLALSMTEIFHSFNMRSRDGSIFKLKTQNVVLWGAFVGSFILTALVTEVGFIANLFGFTPVGLKEYGIAIALAISIIPIVEIEQLIENLWRKHKETK